MRTALDPPTGPAFFPDEERIAEGIAASRTNGRGRVVVPIHRTSADHAQRMLNIMQPGSNPRPHLHPRAGVGVELVCVLRGAVAFITFDPQGGVVARRRLTPGAGTSIADIEPGVYHTFCALEPDTVVLEIKGGPYQPDLDKSWPDWAPPEESPEAGPYFEKLLAGLR